MYPAIQYILRRPYGIHSPFLYDFAKNCLYAKGNNDTFRYLKRLRRNLTHDHSTITRLDVGAGSRLQHLTYLLGSTATRAQPGSFIEKTEKVSTIAKRSLQKEKYCRLFYRMATYLRPQHVLELGTSFGISTAYLAMGHPSADIHTIEACPQTAGIAHTVFQKAGLTNIRQYTDTFSDTLPSLCNEITSVDMAYIDGDHTYNGVMENFSLISKHMSTNGVIIIDDIRWSFQMWRAWKDITNNARSRLSLDLGQMGLVFFFENLSKQKTIMGY